jgi:hypothetical protein
VARVFHPPFADLWAADVDELGFWYERAKWILHNENRRG